MMSSPIIETKCCYNCGYVKGCESMCELRVSHPYSKALFRCYKWEVRIKKPELPVILELLTFWEPDKAQQNYNTLAGAINQITNYIKHKEK
ncbi:MAG: hypothetical protein GY861_27020 [bacterium]|nr:hypothetical protein [bacterium]